MKKLGFGEGAGTREMSRSSARWLQPPRMQTAPGHLQVAMAKLMFPSIFIQLRIIANRFSRVFGAWWNNTDDILIA